jgi:hypothetical protein
MSLTPDLIAAMSKDELGQVRSGYLLALTGPLNPNQRTQIQTVLALVNQQIKKINIDKARADKAVADRKKSAGLAEHHANTGRALGKISPLVQNPPREDELVDVPILGTARATGTARPTRPPVSTIGQVFADADPMLAAALGSGKRNAPPWPKGIATRGECILMRAEQLRNQMRRLTAPLPYSAEFLPMLEAFCVEQKTLVDRERAERKDSTSDVGRAEWVVRQKAIQKPGEPPPVRPRGCTCLGVCLCDSNAWQETWKDDRG